MIKIDGDYDGLIEVIRNTGYDNTGQQQLEVRIEAGPNLKLLQSDVANLKADILVMKNDKANEERLRSEHAGLQDLHDQYQVVLKLVKKGDDALNEGCDSA